MHMHGTRFAAAATARLASGQSSRPGGDPIRNSRGTGAELHAEAVQPDPNNPKQLLQLGLAHYGNGEYDLAIEAIEKAIQLQLPPDDHCQAYFFLWLSYRESSTPGGKTATEDEKRDFMLDVLKASDDRPAAGGVADELLSYDDRLGDDEWLLEDDGTSDESQPHATWPLKSSSVLDVIKRNMGGLKACVAAEEKKGTDLSEKVVMAWDIQPDGSVRNVEVKTPRWKGTSIGNCMKTKIAKWLFPKYTCSPTLVTFPFKLSGEAPKAREGTGPEKATGYLRLNTNPWSRIYIDGKDTGRTTPLLRYELPAGEHTVRMVRENQGCEEATTRVRIKPDEVTTVTRRLECTR